ncbi:MULTISPECIES: DUF6789 family protein [Halomicrobium]|uniref:Uncharacterized protein n=2 Tax=Halomicrobium mukohataei TaxID=57705 RepID=C7NZ27_HALMD|nr:MULTISPECIES: DUF6789 family protein [Halomicrobium]ACV46713.1 conserved hypothetical protein [Halomicrobium mukohataei DSM 12286]QCD65222.1 hypothetical protein E5139_06060 [Halomicrobium mukohataei]QFR20028.1 hypothetical protein GBQ70_06055 [Halomicrobium sp. ZPS1]
MADAPHGVDDPVDDPVDELSETEEFDSLIGIVGDGVVGAAGGLVGTALSTVVLLIAESLGVFERSAFALLTELVGIEELVPPILAGYLIFLAGGMVPWPLLYVSLKEYLPGRRDPVSGAFFGFAIWTGFALGFYTGQSGLALVGYAVLTLLAHVVYGVGLGLVFEYFQSRPSSIV